MELENWVSEAEDFVKKFQKDFENKKLALFISSLNPVEKKQEKQLQLKIHGKLG
jgi:menaquinone-dependent protoporphyrinogen IX oxidase